MDHRELKETRLRLGLTQKQFAEGLGVSQQFVSQMEKGRRPVSDLALNGALWLDPKYDQPGEEDEPEERRRAREVRSPRGPYGRQLVN